MLVNRHLRDRGFERYVYGALLFVAIGLLGKAIFAGRSEADLRGALDTDGNGGNGKPKTDGDAAEDEKPVDYQLVRAVDLIRGIALSRRQAN